MSELDDETAVDIGKVVSNRQRPLLYAVAGALTLWAPGGVEMLAARSFRTEEVKHEILQDEFSLKLKEQMDANKKSAQRSKEIDTKIIKLMMRDLDLLRAQVVRLSHKRERGLLRSNFAAQRNNAVELLVEAQKE